MATVFSARPPGAATPGAARTLPFSRNYPGIASDVP